MIPPSTAIFIEPRGSLRDALVERKAWLEKAMPGQAFVLHPPHCTLLFGNYGPASSWLEPLRLQLAAFPAFALVTDGWQQFPADALAGGGHTVAFRVRRSSELARLQLTVAECLGPFRVSGPALHPLAHREPFARSLEHFGFPFVGDHWIPHFTIGSPVIGPNSPLLAQLMSGTSTHQFEVRTVSHWEIEGERHTRLRELALARPPT